MVATSTISPTRPIQLLLAIIVLTTEDLIFQWMLLMTYVVVNYPDSPTWEFWILETFRTHEDLTKHPQNHHPWDGTEMPSDRYPDYIATYLYLYGLPCHARDVSKSQTLNNGRRVVNHNLTTPSGPLHECCSGTSKASQRYLGISYNYHLGN